MHGIYFISNKSIMNILRGYKLVRLPYYWNLNEVRPTDLGQYDRNNNSLCQGLHKKFTICLIISVHNRWLNNWLRSEHILLGFTRVLLYINFLLSTSIGIEGESCVRSLDLGQLNKFVALACTKARKIR